MKKTPSFVVFCFVLAALISMSAISLAQAKAADPYLTVTVRDDYTVAPIENATVKIYNSSYALVGQAITPDNGTAKFSVDPNDWYYVVVSHSEYDDKYTGRYVGDEDETVTVELERVQYTGSVKTSAWTTQASLNPGESSTLKISIYNENKSYSITLTNVSIQFPWYGFYEDHWEGNVTISEGMSIEVESNSSWSYSLSFTVPSDSRAYGSLFGDGQVAFLAKAPAWKRVVVMTVSGPEYGLEPQLTMVTINPLEPPAPHWYDDFKTTPIISRAWPMADQTVNSALSLVQILLIVSIVCSVALAVLIFRLSRQLTKRTL